VKYISQRVMPSPQTDNPARGYPHPAGFRGTTLAVHSTIGFGAAFLGPLTVGMVLDFFGGGQTGWAMAFVTMAAGCLLGPIFLTRVACEQ